MYTICVEEGMGKSNMYLTYYLSKLTRIYALCPDIDLLGSNGGSSSHELKTVARSVLSFHFFSTGSFDEFLLRTLDGTP